MPAQGQAHHPMITRPHILTPRGPASCGLPCNTGTSTPAPTTIVAKATHKAAPGAAGLRGINDKSGKAEVYWHQASTLYVLTWGGSGWGIAGSTSGIDTPDAAASSST